uniref:PHD-type domain-containing protein n=1 Tax=Eptatretus burgeri TaxID=7764 RepID=A0A8C4NBN5_EPTBU
ELMNVFNGIHVRRLTWPWKSLDPISVLSFIAPLSEFAPPLTPMVDHLVASNPFDDDFVPTKVCLPGFVAARGALQPPGSYFRMPGGCVPPGSGSGGTPGAPVFVSMPAPGMNFVQGLVPGGHPAMGPGPGGGMPGQGLPQGNGQGLNHMGGQSFGQGLSSVSMSQSPSPTMGQLLGHGMRLNNGLGSSQPMVQSPGPTGTKSGPPGMSLNSQSAQAHNSNQTVNSGQSNNGTHDAGAPAGTGGTGNGSNDGNSGTGGTSGSQGPGQGLSTSGPMSCSLCLQEVVDGQEALPCEAACHRWFHRKCAGLTELAYKLLMGEDSAVWACDACLVGSDFVHVLEMCCVTMACFITLQPGDGNCSLLFQ